MPVILMVRVESATVRTEVVVPYLDWVLDSPAATVMATASTQPTTSRMLVAR
jgi:hypothetical protein